MANSSRTLLFFPICLLLIGCNSNQNNPDSSSKIISPSLTNLTVSGYQVRHTEAQLNYLNSENYTDTTPYNGNMSVSAPVPVHFEWEANSTNPFFVRIYEGEDLSKPVISYQTEETQFDFYNTKLGATYYAQISSGQLQSKVVSFTTDNVGPRNLFVEGVENIRDLGGWCNIKQGMIYRSGRFNEDKKETPTLQITEKGLYEANNVLKIKTEIDLRKTSTNEVGGLTDKSVLGDNVNYVQLPMAYNGNNILTFAGKVSGDTYEYDNPAAIKSFFEILADERNYPIDFHCSIGKDRTGCLAYLIEGLMGADEEHLMRDYMFTNFSNAGMCKPTEITGKYGKTLADYENGDTLQEKIYNYLSSENIGVSTTDLDKIINILKVS